MEKKINDNDKSWIQQVKDKLNPSPNMAVDLVKLLLGRLQEANQPLIAGDIITAQDNVDKDALRQMPVKNQLILIDLIKLCIRIDENSETTNMNFSELATTVGPYVFRVVKTDTGEQASHAPTIARKQFKKILNNAEEIKNILIANTTKKRKGSLLNLKAAIEAKTGQGQRIKKWLHYLKINLINLCLKRSKAYMMPVNKP